MAGRSTDQSTMAQAFAGPGMDTRIWASWATVDAPDETGEQAVVFDQEDGQIYVACTLQPSMIPVNARVGMLFAGAGEAAWFPLLAGDEVFVILPEGDPRAGALIVSRANNAYDPFPFDSVAGVDPTMNSLAVLRTRPAVTIESGATVMLRSAAAGAFFRLDAKGGITSRDGSTGVLQQSADLWGYQSGPGDAFHQFDLNAQRYSWQIGSANATFCGDGADVATQGRSIVKLPGPCTLAMGGLDQNNAVEHAASTESVVNLLVQVLALVGANIAVANPGPLTGAALAPLLNALTTPTVQAAIVAAIQAAAVQPQASSIAAALFAALATPTAKPAGVPGFGQLQPGLGSQGLVIG